MGEETGVETADTLIYLGSDYKSGACGPEYRNDRIILAIVGLTFREDASAAIYIAVAVDETAAGTGVFEFALIVVAQYFRLGCGNIGMRFEIVD